jgi:hypothetical protein
VQVRCLPTPGNVPNPGMQATEVMVALRLGTSDVAPMSPSFCRRLARTPAPRLLTLVLALLPAGCELPPDVPGLPGLPVEPWPGPIEVRVVDRGEVFGENLSGVHFDAGSENGVLWTVRNGPSALYRLVPEGEFWVPDPDPGWVDGRPLRYPDGSGDPDAEGVTRVPNGPWAAVYVGSERDNDARGESRNAVLRFEPEAASDLAPGEPLVATHAWDLTGSLPPTGPNLGIEGITWIPSAFLVGRGFLDPDGDVPWVAGAPDVEGGGVFAVGLEATGHVYLVVLDHREGGHRLLGRIETGLEGVMGLHFDHDTGELWAVCDFVCSGRKAVLVLDETGRFRVDRLVDPPAHLPDLNHEGFTIAPMKACTDGLRPAWWTDDDETGGVAIWQGWLRCEMGGDR